MTAAESVAWQIPRQGQPVRGKYRIAFIAERISVLRGRPATLGIPDQRREPHHSVSVRLLVKPASFAAHAAKLCEIASLRTTTSWRINSAAMHDPASVAEAGRLNLSEMGMTQSRIERLKRVGGEGGSAKRASRIAFYVVSRAMVRAPGISRLSAGLDRLALAPWIWLKLRSDAYLAMARATEGASRRLETPEADHRRIGPRMRPLGITEDVQCFVHGASSGDELDLFDDGAVAAASNQSLGIVTWDSDGQEMPDGVLSAARLILGLLRRRCDLRSRFPRALSDGPQGAFARWLKNEGIAQYGLSAEYNGAIDAAFAADLAAKARQVALYDDALRAREPLFLLPPGKSALVASLFAAVADGTLRRENAWWLLLESAEDPGREVVQTWLFTPDWQQRFPDGTTVFGCDRFSDWIRQSFRLSAPWLAPSTWPLPFTAAEQIKTAYRENKRWRRDFPRALNDAKEAADLIRFLGMPIADVSPIARQLCTELEPGSEGRALVKRGVNIFGHFSYPSGLRTSMQSIIAGLHLNGVDTAFRDVRVSLATDEPLHHKFSDLEFFDKTIIHVQPDPFFKVAAGRSDLYERSPRTYRIGYWYWEFDTVPASWDPSAGRCDELWAATEFVAQGLRARYNLPIHVFLPGLELSEFKRMPRSYFGFSETPFVFLFIFHMTSVAERKNPLALIAAFRRAFGEQDDALLVIKTAFGEQFSDELVKIQNAALGARVRVINAVYTKDETLSLMACSDAYISLHRSEGLGLTIAEAMLLGKPAIATGYSGNLAFMNEANSLLVDYQLIELGREYPPYAAGLHWAEPSVDHASALMRKLYDDRHFAAELGARGAADLLHRLSYANAGAQMANRLDEIDRLKIERT